MSQCTATSKRTHERCKAQAITGRNVCRHHGGKTPQGIALPQTTHGRYSKHLPTRMLASFDASMADPDLLSLRSDIALADSKLSDLLTKVDTGESGAAWKSAYDALQAFKRANLRKDADGAREAMQDLERVIYRGHSSSAAWDELARWLEQRRKLAESERKRLVDLQQMVTSEQAMLLVTALTQAVRDHVSDPDALRSIADDLARLTHRPAA